MPLAKIDEKKELRRQVLCDKGRMAQAVIARQSRFIVRHLTRWVVFKKAQCILFYAPLRREAQIQSLMKRAWDQKKKVCLPVLNPNKRQMRPVVLRPDSKLVAGPYGVLHPMHRTGRPMKPGSIDLVLVPGLAFDRKGNRLGRGKGYFDRFLKQWAIKVPKVGVALHKQLMKKVPTNRWDIAMDYIVYPRGIVACGRE